MKSAGRHVKHSITRRGGLASALSIPFVLGVGPRAAAQPDLPEFPQQDVNLLTPGSPGYEQYQPTYNSRTAKRPRWRAMCKTATGLRRLIDAARDRNIPFAVRAGGHSFEGLSQSETLSIDVRPLNNIQFIASDRTLIVGSGVSLGAVYQAAAKVGMAFPAGSCPTVGLAGHIHGGGFGLISRTLGLASDSMRGAEIVDAQGALKVATQASDPDLFWALQGGGGGTFGAAASYKLQLHPVSQVLTFIQSMQLGIDAAAQVINAWQNWAPNAPRELTSILSLRAASNGTIGLRLAGQSLGSSAQLQTELRRFASLSSVPPTATFRTGSFIQAIDRFSGGWNYESKFSKGKSDFVMNPLSYQAIELLLRGIAAYPPNNVIAILDSYGGAVADRRNNETAFAFRDALFCIQYYSSWFKPSETAKRLAQIRSVYDALRSQMSGFAYVNYCDLDLRDWPRAYWSSNLDRLRQVKSRVDPKNLFRSAQSVPVLPPN